MGNPWLGASANRTVLGMTVLKSHCGKCFCNSAETWWARFVRASYIVLKMPKIVNAELKAI